MEICLGEKDFEAREILGVVGVLDFVPEGGGVGVVASIWVELTGENAIDFFEATGGWG